MEKMTKFRADESGSGTYIAGGLFFVGAVMSGLALDAVNAFNEAGKLQIAADAAALAAAANIDDIDVAKAAAMETVRRNLGDTTAIVESDITFGHVDETDYTFAPGADADGNYSAVTVDGFRTLERSSEISTHLVRLIGFDEFEAKRKAVAGARMGGGGGVLAGCEDASIISTEGVNTGGGITLTGAICIHGATHIQTGGNDWYGPEVRFSSENLEDIKIAKYSPGDLPVEQLMFARELEPVILPEIDNLHAEVWADVAPACNFDWRGNPNDPNKPDFSDFEAEGTYSGTLLPSFVMNNGVADVVCWDNHQTIQPGDLKPYTIYVAQGSVQFSGNVQQDNIAVIGQRQLGVGGGDNLAFDQVYFLSETINLAGNINWGPRGDACVIDEYQVYLFGTKSLSMGGFNHDPTVRNIVGVAPSISLGGNMSASGIYLETGKTLQLGGGVDIHGCGTLYTSEFELADTTIPAPDVASGSFLMR